MVTDTELLRLQAQLLGLLRDGRRRSHGFMGRAVQMQRNYKMGSSTVFAAMDRRKTASESHSESQLSSVQHGVLDFLSEVR